MTLPRAQQQAREQRMATFAERIAEGDNIEAAGQAAGYTREGTNAAWSAVLRRMGAQAR